MPSTVPHAEQSVEIASEPLDLRRRAGNTVASYFPRELAARLDRWRAAQRRPITRSEAIRLLVSDRLRNEDLR